MINLRAATDELARLVSGTRDEQLTAPTPCADTSVADLLDHIDGLSQAFTDGAEKRVPEGGPAAPSADGSRLGSDWRARIPGRLDTLAQAWQQDSAWTGVANVGGLEASGQTTGLFAGDELLVHGWDLAVATGQPFSADPDVLGAVLDFVRQLVADSPDGSPGLFGPPVSVADGASPLQQLLALTGRDPAWSAARPTSDA